MCKISCQMTSTINSDFLFHDKSRDPDLSAISQKSILLVKIFNKNIFFNLTAGRFDLFHVQIIMILKYFEKRLISTY